MKLVDFFCANHRMTEEYLDYDAQDKSFLKAKPEEFSRQEGRQLNILMERLNVSLDGTSIRERLSAQSEIDKMLNKSEGHLDHFISLAKSNEKLCGHLIERACFTQHNIEFKNQYEAKEHLSYYAMKTITNDILGRINSEIDSSDGLLDTKGKVSHKAKEYLPPQMCRELVIRLINAEIGGLENVNKELCADITDKPYDSMALILINYINNHARYTVGPEKFSDLLMAYYSYNAGKFDLPSAAQLNKIVDNAVKKFESVKSFPLNILKDLLKNSDNKHNAIYVENSHNRVKCDLNHKINVCNANY
ncbi:hypothetical protein [Yersinia intermedia]|uniref:hypothetical protein n=1 Tax=Yersinia intermedia TaxID=631 RepID=UPI0025AB0390|nr:hypothetical protein [Yersinia intermedia]MDN0116597.1 hypothetical protein [Yersinia intermedia]